MKSYLRCGTCTAVLGVILVSACPANADLVHWYKFDDTGSSNYTAVDSAGSVNATLADTSVTRGYQATDGALWTAGKIGGALEFKRANNNGVGVADDLLGSSYTVAAWIKGSSLDSGDENLIFEQYNGNPGRFLFEVRGGKLGVFEGSGSGATVGSTLATDTWYHVAVTNSNKAVTVYLNGNVDSTVTFSNDAATGGASNDVGGLFDNSRYYSGFDGLIDDLRIYNTALTQTEILALPGVPEPSACILLSTGVCALAAYAWRKRK
jgi:hypothetical protein